MWQEKWWLEDGQKDHEQHGETAGKLKSGSLQVDFQTAVVIQSQLHWVDEEAPEWLTRRSWCTQRPTVWTRVPEDQPLGRDCYCSSVWTWNGLRWARTHLLFKSYAASTLIKQPHIAANHLFRHTLKQLKRSWSCSGRSLEIHSVLDLTPLHSCCCQIPLPVGFLK